MRPRQMIDSHRPEEDWSQVVFAFCQLRERGSALSSQDLTILQEWSKSGSDPEQVIAFMELLSEDCLKRGLEFPSSLRGVDSKIRKLISGMR